MTKLGNLSPPDFEDLCRDILQAETGQRFSAFGAGADGGVDGRHSKGPQSTIVQCKHYQSSTFSQLKSALNKEVPKIDLLKPSRYIFLTSQSLTPARSDELASVLGDRLKHPEDIWGAEDIEAALKRHPDIEKAHLKLWMTSTAVLEKVLHSGLEAHTAATKAEVLDELRVYVRNPSFDAAFEKLERHRVLVVSGPPGVGKTTLAKMLTYHYLNDDWQFCAIRSLDDGFVKLDEEKRTIFFFDDFLGQIELDRQALVQRDGQLARFVKRVRVSKNSRFILTTRAHIFEEARRLSDHMDEGRFQLSKFLLDVGQYTRSIKARILFNHLAASDLNGDHIEALLQGDWLKKIVDHPNYNPRLIAHIAAECPEDLEPSAYPKFAFKILENPALIWAKAYRSLSMRCQNLLVALYFGNQYRQSIKVLRENFNAIHNKICEHYSQPSKPDDFEEALKSLESGFVAISGNQVRFVNPSVRDFLKEHLSDGGFLGQLPTLCVRAEWAQNLWDHLKHTFQTDPDKLKMLAQAFIQFANKLDQIPNFAKVKSERYNYWYNELDDLSIAERGSLLLDLFEQSGDRSFLDAAISVLKSEVLGIDASRDSRDLPELHWRISCFVDNNVDGKIVLLTSIETALVRAIEAGIPMDELVAVKDDIDEYLEEAIDLGTIEDAINSAIDYEFDEISERISELTSESELNEHMELLEFIAKHTGRSAETAKNVVHEKISEIEVADYDDYQPSSRRRSGHAVAEFSDNDLISLFSTLSK
ncbi:restriction endonuclease [Pseudovibrio ascidiaceicola]|uniref:nSTAND3 domain-containing NTPase n=1 Tax=Pseudovibrio ascidiaceicola TaxID=285279 RepID=UPI003D369C97